MPQGRPREWWWLLTIDHPGTEDGLPDAYTGGKSRQVKVWCIKCFEAAVDSVMAQDIREVRDENHPRREVRTDRVVKDICALH